MDEVFITFKQTSQIFFLPVEQASNRFSLPVGGNGDSQSLPALQLSHLWFLRAVFSSLFSFHQIQKAMTGYFTLWLTFGLVLDMDE